MAEDYKTKLEKFFADVPNGSKPLQINQKTGVPYYGWVASGDPPFKDKEQARTALESNLVKDDPTFTKLTGLTHRQLLENWTKGGILTSCNSFVGRACQAAGVINLGTFNLKEYLEKKGKAHCWVTPNSGEVPQFGDIFETRSRTPGKDYENLHVGISLKVEGSDWHTIEGGQGGPGAGVDRVARCRRPWPAQHLLGWVDIRLLASGKGPLPRWLVGTWVIYAAKEQYYYKINRQWEVRQLAYKPGQHGEAPIVNDGEVKNLVGNYFEIHWKHERGVEKFTYDWDNSRPEIMERMKGVAANNTPLSGVRL